MKVDNPTGVTNNVKVNIPKFHLDLGPEPGGRQYGRSTG